MILVDSNIIIDVTSRSAWADRSEAALERVSETESLAINPIIYAEVAGVYQRVEDVEAVLGDTYERLTLPYGAGFLAGQAFREYRRRGGVRTSPIPDFYIGAHAMHAGLAILTRDVRGYRSYFPQIELIAP